jgi:hypothetical protein
MFQFSFYIANFASLRYCTECPYLSGCLFNSKPTFLQKWCYIYQLADFERLEEHLLLSHELLYLYIYTYFEWLAQIGKYAPDGIKLLMKGAYQHIFHIGHGASTFDLLVSDQYTLVTLRVSLQPL